MQRSRRRWCSAAGAACATAVCVARASDVARADAAGAPSVSWQAPPGCPDGAAVQVRLQAALGGELAAYARDWQVQGSVSGSARQWQLLLELKEPERAPDAAALQRVLRAPRCEDLVEAAAVAIAIAIGDAREVDADAAPAAAAATGVEPVAARAAVPADSPSPAASAPAVSQHSLEVSLEALLDSASVSGPALGGSLGIGSWLGALGFDLHGTWLPAHGKHIGPGQDADFGLLAGGARAYYRVWGSAESVRLAPCAGFELGRYSADSQGLISAARMRDTWLAPSLGVELRASLLGRLAARSRLELLLPLKRQLYRVDRVQAVHEVPALTVRWSVGIDGDIALP